MFIQRIKMMIPKVISRIWSFVVFFCSKRARLTGQSPDGRERALLNHVLQNAEKGNAESVLNAIDTYSRHTWLMNIGNEMGSILDAAVQKFDPRVAFELGTYCGYSAIRIASKMTKPDSKLISLEMNPQNCEIAIAMIEHAGLSSKVEVVEGILNESLEELSDILEEMGAPYFDFIFLDHFKEFYLPDFLSLKERGMLGKGTGIVANGVGFPGATDFLNYLRTHTEELKTEEHRSSVEYVRWLPCIITVSTYKAELPVFIRT